jgi:hypothetical protein
MMLGNLKLNINGIGIRKIGFHALEMFAFVMPAIPNLLPVRFGILSFYFVLHYFKAQLWYARIKNQVIYWDFKDKKMDSISSSLSVDSMEKGFGLDLDEVDSEGDVE